MSSSGQETAKTGLASMKKDPLNGLPIQKYRDKQEKIRLTY